MERGEEEGERRGERGEWGGTDRQTTSGGGRGESLEGQNLVLNITTESLRYNTTHSMECKTETASSVEPSSGSICRPRGKRSGGTHQRIRSPGLCLIRRSSLKKVGGNVPLGLG